MVSAYPRVLALFGGDLLFGQERANLEVLEAVKEAGGSVFLITRRENTGHIDLLRAAIDARGFRREEAPFFDLTKRDGPIRNIGDTLRRAIEASACAAKIARDFRPTHIYLFNIRLAVNFLPFIYLCRTPVVYRAGDIPPRHNLFWRFVWRLLQRRVSQFVGNSQFVVNRLREIGVEPSKSRLIYSRPPKRLPASQEQAMQLPDFIAPGGPVVIYVGQITPDKGVHVLTEAIRLLVPDVDDVQLLVLGRLDHQQDEFARRLRATVAADSILATRVLFTGFTEDVQSGFRAARVHAAPSLWDEPLANTVLEAKEAGLPSVVFSSGGLPEVVRHGIDGTICDGKNAEALAAALLPYLKDAELAKIHGAAARRSLETLNASGFAANWLAVFDESNR